MGWQLPLPLASVTPSMLAGGPAFSAYLSADQAASGSAQRVNFNIKDYDYGTCFNNTGSTVTLNGISVPAYSWAPNIAGLYLVNLTILIGAAASGSSRNSSIYKNGVFARQVTADPQNLGTSYGGGSGLALIVMNGTTDYLTAYARSAGTTPVFAGGATLSRFEAFMARSSS